MNSNTIGKEFLYINKQNLYSNKNMYYDDNGEDQDMAVFSGLDDMD